MSQRDEEEAVNFFEHLAGRADAKEPSADQGVSTLRNALLDQIETIHEAKTSTKEDLSAEEKIRMGVLRQQFIENGVIGQRQAPKLESRTEESNNWLQWCCNILFGHNGSRLIVVSASFVLALTIGFDVLIQPASEPDIMRGGNNGIKVLVTKRPADTVETLTEQLSQVGVDVLPVQLNDNEWGVTIDVPRSANLSTVQKILRDNGLEINGDPPYKVSIRRQ